MKKISEELRSWSDTIELAGAEKSLDDASAETELNRTDKEQKRADGVVLSEMPERFDSYGGSREYANDYVHTATADVDKDKLVLVAEHNGFSTYRNPKGSDYMAVNSAGKFIAVLRGTPGKQGILKIDNTAAVSGNPGVMLQIFDDILGEGKYILSDTLHSPSAEKFWRAIISDTSRVVYLVFDRKPQMRATPEKLDKYWGDENSVSAGIQFLLVK